MDKLNKTNSIKYNLTWDSLKINKDGKEIKEDINYDDVSETAVGSMLEGTLKGTLVSINPVAYPLFSSIGKGIDTYKNVKVGLTELYGLKNEKEIKEIAFKTAVLSGVKAGINGVFDSLLLTGLISFATSILGPTGILLAPFIGSIYNFTKESLLSKYGK